MRIFHISNDQKKKFSHHKDIRMPERVTCFIPKELTGCEDQIFYSFNLRPVIRFRFELLEIDVDNKKIRVWYTPKPKNFFKLGIRLTKPYVHNLKEIQDNIACDFLDKPKGLVRGCNLDDVPENITSRSIIGMENYIIRSRRSDETIELLGIEEEAKKVRKSKSFNYWVFDQKMLDEGFILTVENDDGVEFIRKIKIGSLPEGEDIVTAYVRPYFCEEYDI